MDNSIETSGKYVVGVCRKYVFPFLKNQFESKHYAAGAEMNMDLAFGEGTIIV